MQRRALFVALVGTAAAAGIVALVRSRASSICDAGFSQRGTRCIPEGCPPPLAMIDGVCDAPDVRVSFPETRFTVNTNDWEEVAQGKEPPLEMHAAAFAVDAFEVTMGHLHHVREDAARAAGNVTLEEAEGYCASKGGRLPTDSEWFVMAAGEKDRRYPWGETGAVCRRAAWGLFAGPCAKGADGPDTVGAHASGDSATGIHDLAGNVAEWIHTSSGTTAGLVRGGSYKTSLAAELRTWSYVQPPRDTRDPAFGFRCAYDAKSPTK